MLRLLIVSHFSQKKRTFAKTFAKFAFFPVSYYTEIMGKKKADSTQDIQQKTVINPLIDPELFEEARQFVFRKMTSAGGIGTLGEKSIHAVLKYYYAPDDRYHEQKVGNYVADILVDGEIIEIQTRNFNTLRDKLRAFLAEHEVTIVYPLPYIKWLSWVDPETGEVSQKRKSPKRGSIYDIMRELYRIKTFLPDPHLHFAVCMINVEETRILNGWSKDKKKGSEREDGIPIQIHDDVRFDIAGGYEQFLPDTLPEQFTSSDFRIHAGVNMGTANLTLNILTYVGIVERIGKDGRAYLYERRI